MTKQEYQSLNQKAQTGEIADDLNPAFILQGVHTDLLVAIAAGQIDLTALAKHTLDARGLDEAGNWAEFRTK